MNDPVFKANDNYNHGEEDLKYNPYPKDSRDYIAYRDQIGRRQLEDHRLFTKEIGNAGH